MSFDAIPLISFRHRRRLIRQELANLLIEDSDDDEENLDVVDIVPNVPNNSDLVVDDGVVVPMVLDGLEAVEDLEIVDVVGGVDNSGGGVSSSDDDTENDVNMVDPDSSDDDNENDVNMVDPNDEVDYRTDDDNPIEDVFGDDEQLIFKLNLAKWVRKNCIPRDATNDLLHLLKLNGHEDLPINRESLLNTPRLKIVPRECAPGEYYHFGLQKSIRRCNYDFLYECEFVELDINIDGLALSKSSKRKIWPILGGFVNKPNTSPIVIGAYTGNRDPKSIDDFLEDFANELRELLDHGIEVTHRRILKPLRIRSYICDAPARALLVGSKGFNSISGCDKCDVHSVNKKYPPIIGNLRTDDSFRNRDDPIHHKPHFLNRFSLLEILGTRMVTQVVPDPMHLLDEGVFLRMLNCIFFTGCPALRLTLEFKKQLDERYKIFKDYIPSEFERRPRSILEELTKWKGTELRFGLLYGFVVLLKGVAGDLLYLHFLKFFVALRYLSAPATHLVQSQTAELLLNEFVGEFGRVYGQDQMVYNVHMLLHIVNEVIRYGPLYGWSAYRFENHMREIKKLLKKPQQILQQLSKRLEEINTINENEIHIGFVGNPQMLRDDVFPGLNSSYKSFQFESFVLKSNLRDSCCYLRSALGEEASVEIQYFSVHNGEDVVLAKPFLNEQPFFNEPVDSLFELGIKLVDGVMNNIIMYRVADIKFKYVRLPYTTRDRTQFVLLPMLHHLTLNNDNED